MQKISYQLAAIVFGTLLGVSVVAGRPSKEVERTYFSGPDFKTEVGYQLLPCNGGLIKKGKRTRWYLESTSPCEQSGGLTQAQCMVCDPGFVNCIRMTCPPDFSIKDKQ